MTPFMPTVSLSPDALVRIEGGEVVTWAECERRLLAARTPAPEGEVVKSYGQKGRALYEAFWARNGDASPPPWDEQAHAIRAMWVNIARDAEPLYASPVVPVGSGQADKMAHVLRGMVKRGTLIDAEAIDRALKLATYKQDPDDDDRAWAASQAEVIGQPVVPVGVSREEIARIIEPELWEGWDWQEDDQRVALAKADAIIAALRPTDTGANHD